MKKQSIHLNLIEKCDKDLSIIQSEFLDELSLDISSNEDEFTEIPQFINDKIKIHISHYPDDHFFQYFSNFTSTESKQCIQYIKENQEMSMSQSIISFYKSIKKTDEIDQYELFISSLQSLSNPTISELYSLNSFVFEPLEFLSTFNKSLIPPLLEELLKLEKKTFIELRQFVNQYLFDHRFDPIISYLKNDDYNSTQKQNKVVQFIQDQFESNRSKRCLFQILHLVDEKIKSFQKPLENILRRSAFDEKKTISILKQKFSLILDIVINHLDDKKLLHTYFTSKSKFDEFKKHKYKEIQENYESIIHTDIIYEFPQSYIFTNANKLSWQIYLELFIKSSSSSFSLDVLIYNTIKKNVSDKLQNILLYIKNSNFDDSKRTHINSLIHQYLLTQSPKLQSILKKLYKIPLKDVYDILTKSNYDEYITLLQNFVITKDTTHENTDKHVPYIKFITNQFIMNLEKTRPYIPNFDHLSISSIHDNDISKYILKKDSTIYNIPNELFYQHLADDKITKKQEKDVFILDNIKMKIANVTIDYQYIIQNEKSFQENNEFIQTQIALEDTTSPFGYFDYFFKLPLLNQKSTFMNSFRNKICTILSSLFLTFFPNWNTNLLSQHIENSIYKYNDNIDKYTRCITILLIFINPKNSCLANFSNLQHLFSTNQINIQNIGKLSQYDVPHLFEFLLPGFFLLDDFQQLVIKNIFNHDLKLYQQKLAINAYVIQYPTRRIPYLPFSLPRISPSFIINDVPISSESDLYPIFINQSQTDIQNYQNIQQNEIEILHTDENIMKKNDPLSDFIQVAFDMLQHL